MGPLKFLVVVCHKPKKKKKLQDSAAGQNYFYNSDSQTWWSIRVTWGLKKKTFQKFPDDPVVRTLPMQGAWV